MIVKGRKFPKGKVLEEICLNCSTRFLKRGKKRALGGTFSNIRKSNAVTCSSRCSKEYSKKARDALSDDIAKSRTFLRKLKIAKREEERETK